MSEHYVLILTADEHATIQRWMSKSLIVGIQHLYTRIKNVPHGDAAMLLDAADSGCTDRYGSMPEEYKNVEEFVKQLRKHWVLR